MHRGASTLERRRLRRFAVALFAGVALCLGGMPGVAIAGESGEVALPAPRRDGPVPLERALALRQSVRAFAPGPLTLAAVSQLLWAAQGITHGDGLRTAPSAGALYPLEVYLLAGAVAGLAPGVHHYDPRGHSLSLRSEGDVRARVGKAALGQDWVAEAPAVVVLAAVYQRTAVRYGRRAERYVHMEAGHAAQNVLLEATALGLGATVVGAFDDGDLAQVLGLPEDTVPLALLPVGAPR
jgi:SagB-type dehydrogenase family enzyme